MFSTLLVGPLHEGERTDHEPTSDRDSPSLTVRAEESEEPEEKGDESLTDDREEEEDTRSTCFSREDICDAGEDEARMLPTNLKKQ